MSESRQQLELATVAITSRESLSSDTLRLSRAAVLEVGSASQTLAAVVRLALPRDKCEMFAPVYMIAALAQVHLLTARRHLDLLVAGGWLTYLGREELGPNTRKTRRTCTYALTKKTTATVATFMELPRWMAKYCKTWAQRAVAAYLVSQHKQAFAAREEKVGTCHVDELPDERDKVTHVQIVNGTGLSPNAAWDALRRLASIEIVEHEPGEWSGNALPSWFRLHPDRAIEVRAMPGKVQSRRTQKRQTQMEAPRVQMVLNLEPEPPPAGEPPPGHDVAAPRPSMAPSTPSMAPYECYSPTPEMTLDLPQICYTPTPNLIHTYPKNVTPLKSEPVSENLLKRTTEGEPTGQNTRAVADSGSAADHFFSVDEEKDGQLAEELFRLLDYRGEDGAIVWQAACLARGPVSRASVTDAARAVRECDPSNRLGYFRAALAENLGDGTDRDTKRETGERKLKALLGRTRNPAKLAGPRSPPSPPQPARQRDGEPPNLGTVLSTVTPAALGRNTNPPPQGGPARELIAPRPTAEELRRRKADLLAGLARLAKEQGA